MRRKRPIKAKYSILHYLGSLILYGVHASKGHTYYTQQLSGQL